MDLKQVWTKAKAKIADTVSSVSFDLWIKTLTPEFFKDGTFTLSATSTMAKQQALNTRHFPHIEIAIKDVAPIVENINIIDAIEKEAYELEIQKKLQEDVGNSSCLDNLNDNPSKQEEKTPRHAVHGITVNTNQTFANFIIGKSNEVVAAAAEAVANNPGKRINPLFIYGGSGLGKTHLLNAIVNHVMIENPKTSIAFVSSERFTNDYVETMRQKDRPVAAFRGKYRTVNILLIDDIQFIRDKQGTQEEFFHTFNDLIQSGRQIVLTSDRHPDEMPTLDERMRSRFKSGLIQDITTPDVEMRMAILQKKASLENYRLSDEVCTFLAQNAVDKKLNIRDMEGNLFKVIFYAGLKNKLEPTIEDCHDALKDTLDDRKFQTTADIILANVCKYFNITKDDIIGKRRNREFVEPRMFAIYLITEFLNIPLINIGKLLGGRDHTTVMHARNKIASQLNTDNRTKRIIDDISKMIKSE